MTLHITYSYNDDLAVINIYHMLYEIMANIMLYSAQLVFLQPMVYDKTSINPLAPWERAGIIQFTICNVFNVKLDESCPEYSNNAISGSSESQSPYIAVGTFEIAAIETINEYKNKIIEIFSSNAFIDTFTKQMNDKLSNYTSLLQYNGFQLM